MLKNLSETIQKILTQQYSKVDAALADRQSKQNSHSSSEEPQTCPQQNNEPKNTKLGIRQQRFSQLKELQGEGYSIRAMARHLGIHRQTIKRYLNMDTLPRKSQGNRHALEPFFPYITARMKQQPNILLRTLWKELKARGYAGAYSTLSEALKYYGIAIGKKAGQNKRLPPPSGASFKPSTTAIWFVSDQAKLRESQRSIVDKLCTASEEIGSAFSLAQNFRQMMVNRTGDKELRGWIDRSTDSGIKQLAAFAKGLSMTLALLGFALFASGTLFSCKKNSVEQRFPHEKFQSSYNTTSQTIDDEEIRIGLAYTLIYFKNSLQQFYTPDIEYEVFKANLFNSSNHELTSDADSLIYTAYLCLEAEIPDDFIIDNYQGAEVAKALLFLHENPESDGAEFFNITPQNPGLQTLGGCRWFQVGCHLQSAWEAFSGAMEDVWGWLDDNKGSISGAAAIIGAGVGLYNAFK